MVCARQLLILLILSAAAGCADDLGAEPAAYDLGLPEGVPPPIIPQNNPLSEARVELGRHLFYDVRLSIDGTMACAFCHQQAFAFSQGGRPMPVGVKGEQLSRNAMSLTNVAWAATLTWGNPVLDSLERQALVPLFLDFPAELGAGANPDAILARLQADARYPAMFTDAFPGETSPIGFGNIVKAIASFERTLIALDSPWDRHLAGDHEAISEAARRGAALFNSPELACGACHRGFDLSSSTRSVEAPEASSDFYNVGLYNVGNTGQVPAHSLGLAEFTREAEDAGKMRAPTLRNIALTAPYMHDGSLATLEEVIEHFAAGGRLILEGPDAGDGRAHPFKSPLVRGFDITPSQTQDLIAFLESLTDEDLITNARYSNPFLDPHGAPTP